MYDAFAGDYDRFVNWKNRLTYELPFLMEQIGTPEQGRVLDAACGTGQHAIALAQRGYAIAGADLSEPMVEQARLHACQAGVTVQFEAAGFGSLSETFGTGGFHALLCLGNSLPHLLSHAALDSALLDFATCLQPGGRLVIQNRNFDAVLENRQRWMGPEAAHEGDKDWLFVRFYDFEPDGLITFNILSLHRTGGSPWQQQLLQTRLLPQRKTDLVDALHRAGFGRVTAWGSLAGDPFDPAASGNLVLTAERG